MAATGVFAMALQPDGKLLIGGTFTAVNGTARNGIARLHAAGSLDTGFDPGSGADAPVVALSLQPGGKVLLGGGFSIVNGVGHGRVARLNPNGSLDRTFVPDVPPEWTRALAVDRRDTVLLGGLFYYQIDPISVIRLELGRKAIGVKAFAPE